MTYKSILNPIVSALLLIAVLPFLLVAVMIILLVDLQNPIFIQKRYGLRKKQFSLIKLRTMKNNKVTFIGSVFRKTGIDEIPQLINICLGHINFVGPRPLTAFDVQRLNWNDSYHDYRWMVKPGLTGLAQLSPICHKKMSWFLDKKYINCQNFWLDMKIITASFFVLFLGKKKVILLMRN